MAAVLATPLFWFNAFNTLMAGVFLTNTGFAFDDRAKQDKLARDGATTVRIWTGQTVNAPDMAGNVPDFRTYNFDGSVIGEYHGKGKVMAAGGFTDVVINNNKKYPHMEPHYLKMYAGGNDGACISALAITGPNNNGMMFWPEVLMDCNHDILTNLWHNGPRNGWHSSETVVGKKADKPDCIWLDLNFSYGLKLTELTIHLPDLIIGEAKAAEWRNNKQHLCKLTPRLLPAMNTAGKKGLFDPIWVFDPPLHFNRTNGLELNPSQVLDWKPERHQLGHLSNANIDFDKAVAKVSSNNHRSRSKRYLSNTLEMLTGFLKRRGDQPGSISSEDTEEQIMSEEELTIYNDARQLVIFNTTSSSTQSATAHCTHNGDGDDQLRTPMAKNNPDYLSIDEEVYCDMLLQSMYPVCTDTITHLCFDADLLMLRRFALTPDPAWVEHDDMMKSSNSTDHKKTLIKKRAELASEKVKADNLEAMASGIPITYRLGQPRPLWQRPYHAKKVTYA